MNPNVGRLVVAGLMVLTVASGCREYEIRQFDHHATHDFDPGACRRVAIITHRARDADGDRSPSYHDRNRLILEAFQVELMKRGLEVVEREKFEKLVNEQMLIRGELTNLSDREKAIRLGKMLDVDLVLYADAMINGSRYVYEKRAFQSEKDVLERQRKANESGVVEGVGSYTIYAYHDIGVTVRAIDAHTGEIVWVGYRMLAVCDEVTERDPTGLTSFATTKKLCSEVLDDVFSARPAPANRKG